MLFESIRDYEFAESMTNFAKNFNKLAPELAKALQKYNREEKEDKRIKFTAVNPQTGIEETVYLSSAMIDRVYWYREKLYRREDAARQLSEYFFGSNDKGDADEKVIENFKNIFGYNFDECCNPNSDGFILDIIADNFDDAFDCNIPENAIWRQAIQMLLDDL